MATRTWPNPQVRTAEKALHEARRRQSSAERLYKSGLSDREHQLKREADIANRARINGREPELYHVPQAGDTVEILNGMSSHPESTVHRWIADSDLAQRKAAFNSATEELVAAEEEWEKARTTKPVSEAEIRGKVKGEFAVNRNMRIAGVDFSAGQVIPQTVSDELPFTKIHLWLQRDLIRTV